MSILNLIEEAVAPFFKKKTQQSSTPATKPIEEQFVVDILLKSEWKKGGNSEVYWELFVPPFTQELATIFEKAVIIDGVRTIVFNGRTEYFGSRYESPYYTSIEKCKDWIIKALEKNGMNTVKIVNHDKLR